MIVDWGPPSTQDRREKKEGDTKTEQHNADESETLFHTHCSFIVLYHTLWYLACTSLMCGIAGKLIISGRPTARDISAMTDALAHRGPDDDGIEIIGQAGLGQRRLAIIDLSPRGHQPMSYQRGRYWITFNGEIYNFQELRTRLQSLHYRFHSNSDTEVILAMYVHYGPQCVHYFNGMFAFALYDKKEETLFAARDRLGKKPFHYFFDGTTFLFASEIKALWTQPEVKRQIDDEAISSYLYWGFVPSPRTGFAGIKKLPPASTLLLKGGKLTIRKYWNVEVRPEDNLTVDEARLELRTLLQSSVKLRMISDVPIGAFLSGGIDSCIVTGLMSQAASLPIRTFTVGSTALGIDEREAAERSSTFHHTQHRVLTVNPRMSPDLIRTIVRAYDEPFGDSSAVPSYIVSELARRHVTVALNGDGGDENFFGYSNYTTVELINRAALTRMPAQALYTLLRPFSHVLQQHPLTARVLRVAHLLSLDPLAGYPLYARGYMNGIDMNDLWNDGANSIERELRAHLPKSGSDAISRILTMDLSHVLPDGLMTKMDIASMQWGLEGRSPLLDYRVVEFAARLPLGYKYHQGETKWILKEACADLIPPEIRALPKRGFVLPVNEWIRTSLRTQFETVFSDREHQMYSILNFETAQQMFRLHLQGVNDYSAQLWKFFMLAKWYDEFFPT